MPKPKKPRRRKDTLLYMSALQMMVGTPAPATIKAAQVEMLNEPNRVPPYAGANLTESQVGPNGEFCGPAAWIRCGLFKSMSQSCLIISRSVRD
jgi:hypothetical protein